MNSEGLLNSEKVCRNCHEDGGEVIAPCRCSGSIKWIHRSCLDTWRCVSPNPQSFSTCDVCKFHYKMKERTERRFMANLKFAFLVIRDLLATIIGINLIIALLGFLISLTDPEAKLAKLIPQFHLVKMSWQPATKKVAIIYECGTVAFFFILGLICIGFLIYKLCTKNRPRGNVSHDRYPYNSNCGDCYFIYCIWPNTPYYYGDPTCNCHGYDLCGRNDCACLCSGGNCKMDGADGLGAVAIVLIVVIAVIVVLGIFFGLILMALLMTKVAQRHLHVLKRKRNAVVMEVADLSKNPEVLLEENLEIEIEPPVVSPILMTKQYEKV